VAPGPFAQNFPSQLQPLFSFDGAPADPEVAKFRADEASAERDVARLVAEYGRAQGEAARGKDQVKFDGRARKRIRPANKNAATWKVAAVEARIKKVRELIQKRAEARQSIVEKRADQLMREADGLGWTVPSGINPPNQSSSGNIGLRR